MEKLNEYQGLTGRLHHWRDVVKEHYNNYKENHNGSIIEFIQHFLNNTNINTSGDPDDYSHLQREKTRLELIRISAAVMGIEFSYAAETAFVSPTLLKIGIKRNLMSLVWALSPFIGFFLCPILGTLSDRCNLGIGRRRPFIILLSVGVFLGLILVPNGEDLGYMLSSGKTYKHKIEDKLYNTSSKHFDFGKEKASTNITRTTNNWGVFFTVLGTVLLDFNADACQSPARAYLLDVLLPEDHAKGLSTFTVMAGLGGFLGYSLGGLNWDETSIGQYLGGHVKAVFTITTFIFVISIVITVTSFKELPMQMPRDCTLIPNVLDTGQLKSATNSEDEKDIRQTAMDCETIPADYNSTILEDAALTENSNVIGKTETEKESFSIREGSAKSVKTMKHYIYSIIYMPQSLRTVCVTNLFCWMAHVCYSLYFTDFVGEAVFNGNPKALEGSASQLRYEEGIRFGCLGMSMYSLSCACYSMIIDKLLKRYKAKSVYVGGLLFYSVGMTIMALTRAKASVLFFSWTAGVMYSTLFTMPYLIVAHYHSMGVFALDFDGCARIESYERGLGTDIAIVSSMVFLAQFILSICMSTIVSITGTTTAVISTASFLSFCGAISARGIMYLDL